MSDAENKNPLSVRARPATKADLARLADEGGFPPATLLAYAADLLAGDYIRCRQCDTPVPVAFGDISGRSFRDLVMDAEKAVRYQRCWEGKGRDRVPAHTPVLVGAEAVSQPPPASGTASEAATRTGGARERTEPPAPVPAQAPKAPRRRKEAPVLVAAGNGQPGTAVPFRAGPDVDCLHENFRGVKGVCPDCKQWVGGKR